MKKLKFLLLFTIVLSLLASVLAPTALAVPRSIANALEDPDAQAAAVILAEASSGTVMYEKNADGRRDPASVTKLMTVLLAVEAYERGDVTLEEKITVSELANFDVTDDSSTQNIKAGEIISFKDVLYCALLASANEACNIIAERVAGTIPGFVQQMNARARELGCTGTSFANTHGLTDPNHYTTARDVYLIMNEVIKHPVMQEIMDETAYVVQATNLSNSRNLKNTNELKLQSSDYYYEPCKGGKTGTTEAAGHCLASYAQNDVMTLICVVLGAENTELENGRTRQYSFYESRRLFAWGFDNFSFRNILTTGDLVTKVDVAMGDGADSVNLVPEHAITALLPNTLEVSAFKREIVIYSEQSGQTVTAPINEGEELGRMTITLDGEEYGTVKLVANTGIGLMRRAYIMTNIRETLENPIVKTVSLVLIVIVLVYICLLIRYNILRARRRREKRAYMRAMREQMQQQELEQARQGVRVPSREEEAAAAATAAPRPGPYLEQRNQSGDKRPITFDDFYNRTR